VDQPSPALCAGATVSGSLRLSERIGCASGRVLAASPVGAARRAGLAQPGGAALGGSVGGPLVQVQSAFEVCEPDAGKAACANLFQSLTDPFLIDRVTARSPQSSAR